MLKKIALATVAASTALVAVPAAADAHPSRYRHSHYENYRGGDNYYNRGYARRDYGRRGYDNGYYGRSRYSYNGRRCRDNGTTGTIVGAIAGGLLGKEIADGGRYRRGDGTTGMIVGGALGALAGRAIDRDC
jgi:hypothetical protein